ncbi:MAG: hypothetical protein ABI852_05515 [Gemmatimonadaceae bacterium]
MPISLTRGGGFTGDVAIAIEGLPVGVTGAVAPIVLGSGVTAATLTLTAGPTAVAGVSTVTIRGIGNGVTASTATVQLTVNIPPAITLTAGSSAVSSPQAGVQTVALTVDRSGGFSGPVALVAEGLPAGVTASFAPATLAAGATSSTLTLNVALSAAIAVTPITIRATGAGVTDKTAAIQLTVTASTTPDFTLTAVPAALSVLPGANASTVVNVARSGGFTGNVTLATSTLPAGITATLTPNPATANTSTLAFTTTAAAVPGAYTVTVTGTATGLTSRTVNVTFTVTAPPGITSVLTPIAGSAAIGTSVQSSIAITRVGGFTGDVTMTAENLPANVTASFAPAVVTGTSSVATFAVGATAVPGVYPVILRASGTGITSVALPYTLTVTPPQGFSVAFTANSTNIVVGGTGALTANITRSGGFAGDVNFTVTGLPAGITAVVNPAAASGATAAVNLTVAGSIAPGQYPATLTGTATGLPNTTTTFTVNVTAVGGGGGNISWAFCDATRVPVFFAFRDGTTGVWTRVTPNASNVFAFTFNQSVGGVAYVLPNGNGFATSVFLQTAAEMQFTANNECTSFPTGGGKTLTGSTTGLNVPAGFTTQSAAITMGNASASATFGGPTFTLNNVGPGPLDLIAIRSTTTITPTFAVTPDGIVIRRSLNLAGGTAITPALNFGAGGESVAPVSATVTIGNGGADILGIISQFRSANGTLATFGIGASSSGATIYGVPSSSLVAGDLHQVVVSGSDAANATNFRGAITYFRDFVNKTVTLGPVLTLPTITASFNTILRPRVTGAYQPEYQTGVGASFFQSGTARTVTVSASKGYSLGANTYDLETPDLAPVTGFQATWGLSNGFSTDYTLTATNAPSSAIVDGTQYLFASRRGTVPPASSLRR